MSATRPYTLGAELERDRLERRVRHATFVVAALRRVDRERRREQGAVPIHVRRAIVDFEVQINAMNARLRELAPEAQPTIERLR
jgi:hypothetical protein